MNFELAVEKIRTMLMVVIICVDCEKIKQKPDVPFCDPYLPPRHVPLGYELRNWKEETIYQSRTYKHRNTFTTTIITVIVTITKIPKLTDQAASCC